MLHHPAPSIVLSAAIEARCSLPVLPFQRVETNWYVITAPFSSGKTTLIDDIRAVRPELLGMPDAGREIINQGLEWRSACGEQIDVNDILRTQQFEETVFALRWERHLMADPKAAYLLDYGLPDVMGFARSSKLSTAMFESRAGLFRYAKVFFLEPLPYVRDETRGWTDEEREVVCRELPRAYRDCGFDLISVPILPHKARRDFVLDHIGAK